MSDDYDASMMGLALPWRAWMQILEAMVAARKHGVPLTPLQVEACEMFADLLTEAMEQAAFPSAEPEGSA